MKRLILRSTRARRLRFGPTALALLWLLLTACPNAMASSIMPTDGWDGPGLGSASLTYYFGTPTPDLSIADQQSAIRAALGVWSSVVAVTFTETFTAGLSQSIDFNFQSLAAYGAGIVGISFASPLLTFGFSEPLVGDVTLALNHTWEVGNLSGTAAIDLEYVAVHEIGHSLGLDHSSVPTAVMFANVGFALDHSFAGLDPDDIAGIRSLYAPVPEASTLLLLGSGLWTALAVRRQRVWRL